MLEVLFNFVRQSTSLDGNRFIYAMMHVVLVLSYVEMTKE